MMGFIKSFFDGLNSTGLSVPSNFVDVSEIMGGRVTGTGKRCPKDRDCKIDQIIIEKDGKRFMIRGDDITVTEFYL